MKKCVFLVLLALSLACVNNKASRAYRLYHQTNARFNSQYNAEELWKNLQKDLAKEPEWNYDKRLPLEKISPTTANNYAAVYDSIIKKSYQNIELHSLNFNGKELVPAIAHAWYLLARCYAQTFRFQEAKEFFEKALRSTEEVPLQLQASLGVSAAALALGQGEVAYPLLFQLEKMLKETDEKDALYRYKADLNLLWMEYFYKIGK